MRRWYREVALAIALTIAAIAFIATAILRSHGSHEVESFAAARKPPPN